MLSDHAQAGIEKIQYKWLHEFIFVKNLKQSGNDY